MGELKEEGECSKVLAEIDGATGRQSVGGGEYYYSGPAIACLHTVHAPNHGTFESVGLAQVVRCRCG